MALWSLAGRERDDFAPVSEAVSTLAAVVAAAVAAIYAANAFRIETRVTPNETRIGGGISR